jgi:hypothetical protein
LGISEPKYHKILFVALFRLEPVPTTSPYNLVVYDYRMMMIIGKIKCLK